MTGTKFFVIHIKQIIKFFILFVLIIIAVISFIFIFNKQKPAKNNNFKSKAINSIYIPGDYFSQIFLADNNNSIKIKLSVDKNKILAIKLFNPDSQQKIFYPTFKPVMQNLEKKIIRQQSLDIPKTKEYFLTEKILLSAVNKALKKAKTS